MTIVARPTRTTRFLPLTLRPAIAALRAIVKALINRRAAMRVSEMPDRMLKDIGLRRDDIHDALHADWRDDPTFRLAIAAARARHRMEP
ncbi:DUF1127 domain-containing protein [Aurantimonas sp. Leaf443]|uniref:DUF1127 domain-containing protein n=1 Tax=Aurantimonas sp. Leaf443 TaxID=1736378 RepID=UPI0007016A3F|nr:DUF1127 domain-containing protein [Aurantimonas sp. Leaf443]KQT87942.1 hypothetical protein ASG48_00285 [Aurantimonas sp. Leaf443]